MREFLFRGKRVRNGEWVEGFYFNRNWEQIIHHFIKYETWDEGMVTNEAIPETVGQYTGLTDKNGKKIFEGDIVKTKYGRLCVVEWLSTQCFCGFDLTVYDFDFNSNTKAPGGWDLYFPENLEIVGNIHDNPELLEVKE